MEPKSKKARRSGSGSKASGSFDLKAIYEKCLNDLHADDDYLRSLEDSGAIEVELWPLLLQKMEADEQNDSDGNWIQACFVLLKLVNIRNTHLSKSDMNGPLSFMNPKSKSKGDDNNDEQKEKILLNKAAFTKFLITIVNLASLPYPIEYLYHDIVQFLTMAYANLTSEMMPILREPLLEIIGIGLWECMPNKRYRELLLLKSNAYKRRWMVHLEKEKNDVKGQSEVYSFLPKVLDQFFASTKEDNSLIDQKLIHSTMQLLIDLLSCTSTRRYLRPYLLCINLSTKCKICPLYNPKNKGKGGNTIKKDGNVFHSLTDTLQAIESFAIEDISAAPLSPMDMASIYHERAHILQKLCLRHYPDVLSDIVYAGVGMVAEEGFLRKVLRRVVDDADGSPSVLIDLCHRLRLLDRDRLDDAARNSDMDVDGNDNNVEEEDRNENTKSDLKRLVTEVLIYHHALRPSEAKVLSEHPLYPDERLLWNPHLVPPGHLRQGQELNGALALPKMSLQFLTFSDYLLRCFKLLRLESAYEIRSDLVDVVKRMRPALRHGYNDEYDEADLDEDEKWSKRRSLTEFHGWSRMGLELTEDTICPVRLIKVSPPKLGEKIPSEVLAEITLNLKHCGQKIREEWDSIGEFDNLFLLGVDATAMNGGSSPTLEAEDTDNTKSIPDEEDTTFPHRFGIIAVRGCMVLEVRDEDGNILSDPSYVKNDKNKGADSFKRTYKVALDPAQYAADAIGSGSSFGTKVYQSLNVIVRRQGKENNFKAVLETVKSLMKGAGSVNRSVPRWLQPVLLGYGNPALATFTSSSMMKFAKNTSGVNSPDAALDYGDTFIDEKHLKEAFDGMGEIVIADDGNQEGRKKYCIQIESSNGENIVKATAYPFPSNINGNTVPFTPVQVKAIRSGLSPGLTMIVGPPGTGKTDVAVQIIANLYHSFPSQRTVIVTHSNAALNDLFEKVMARGDIDERYMLRLGSGERDLQTETEFDFTKIGRVNHILARRSKLLEEVQQMSESLGISGVNERGADGSPSYTCETAAYFYLHHIEKRIQIFNKNFTDVSDNATVGSSFPFAKYFEIPEAELSLMTKSAAKELFKKLKGIFDELGEYRPLELLRSQRQRIDYLLTKQVKIVAMTCTHAAIARSHLIKLGFQYDNIVMEEAGQMLDIETFVPLLLQSGEVDSNSRLKRICLIGDQNQLPPVVKNSTFSKYSNLDQSLFTRLIRLGVPTIDLNKQGRSRAEIANLYNWRYNGLGNLAHVSTKEKFINANPGFSFNYQLINVEDFEGRGETTPTPYYYQNTGEAEYAVAIFQYMVLIGYPPENISILTTYNGQKGLIADILSQRCGVGTPLAGIRPSAISTVDKYQGQQNDYIILSLVRTKSVGHLRDIRRLIVAVSRARLGMFVLCRQNVFDKCHELNPVMKQFAKRPNKLHLVTGEEFADKRSGDAPADKRFIVDDVTVLGNIVHSLQQKIES